MKDLSLAGPTTLRRLTLRCSRAFDVLTSDRSILVTALLTIRSPFFCKLVFEVLGPLPERFFFRSCTWSMVELLLEKRIVEGEDIRLIFRVEEVNGREIFQRYMMDNFPRLGERGRIHFE